MIYKGICRTALAAPGLLNTYTIKAFEDTNIIPENFHIDIEQTQTKQGVALQRHSKFIQCLLPPWGFKLPTRLNCIDGAFYP